MANGHGGKREGSGRPVGTTVSAISFACVREIALSEKNPLLILCEIASNQNHDVETRTKAAEIAASYMFQPKSIRRPRQNASPPENR